MNSFATSCRETEAPDSGWVTRTRVHLEPDTWFSLNNGSLMRRYLVPPCVAPSNAWCSGKLDKSPTLRKKGGFMATGS